MLAYFISAVAFGFVIGSLARWAVPGPDPMPAWLTIFIGLTGSLVGGGIVALAATLSTSAAAATVPRTSAKRPLRGRGWKRMCLLLARRTRSRISVST